MMRSSDLIVAGTGQGGDGNVPALIVRPIGSSDEWRSLKADFVQSGRLFFVPKGRLIIAWHDSARWVQRENCVPKGRLMLLAAKVRTSWQPRVGSLALGGRLSDTPDRPHMRRPVGTQSCRRALPGTAFLVPGYYKPSRWDEEFRGPRLN